jgi:hypothetical protein
LVVEVLVDVPVVVSLLLELLFVTGGVVVLVSDDEGVELLLEFVESEAASSNFTIGLAEVLLRWLESTLQAKTTTGAATITKALTVQVKTFFLFM